MAVDSPPARLRPSPDPVPRRSVMRGAAWAVPTAVVPVGAPALAASPAPCSPVTFSYDDTPTGAVPAFTIANTVRVTPTITATTGTPPTYGGAAINGTIGHVVKQRADASASNLGNVEDKNALLLNIGAAAGTSTTLRITFTRVADGTPYSINRLTLAFRDLTSGNGSDENLTFSPAATSYANVTNSNPVVGISSAPGALRRLAGSGTPTSLGYNNGNGTYYDATATFTGPLTSLDITFTNTFTGTSPARSAAAVGITSISGC